MLLSQKYGENLHVNYSPFGAILYGRNWSSEKYRYGFNGMEKDDELKGAGNSYDFGARMYDNRLGRWFAPDAKEKSFLGISTYSFSYNNPIVINDPDGKNGEVTINYATHTVVLSTTFFLVGPGGSDEIAKQLQNNWDKGTGTYLVKDANDPSIVWTVKVDATFIYEKAVAENAEKSGLKTKEDTYKSIPNEEFSIPENSNILFILEKDIGKGIARMGGNMAWASNNPKIPIHEGLHLLGFDERYLSTIGSGLTYDGPYGLSKDFMSNNPGERTMMELMSFHYADVLDFALKTSGGHSGSYCYDFNSCSYQTETTREDGGTVTRTHLDMIDDTGGGKNPDSGVKSGTERVVGKK